MLFVIWKSVTTTVVETAADAMVEVADTEVTLVVLAMVAAIEATVAVAHVMAVAEILVLQEETVRHEVTEARAVIRLPKTVVDLLVLVMVAATKATVTAVRAEHHVHHAIQIVHQNLHLETLTKKTNTSFTHAFKTHGLLFFYTFSPHKPYHSTLACQQ